MIGPDSSDDDGTDEHCNSGYDPIEDDGTDD